MRNKLIAGLLGIFLGSFGVHKFYLGKTGIGILYVCLFWTGLPGFIGFIEGIFYLAMSEEDFNRRYNPGATVGGIQSAMNDLVRLKSLMDQGIITPSEYEERRERLMQKI
ncbi:MAG: NINE protein [Firmicutes bacterium]|nr:NINE protein [Bacillota bacterium]MCL5063804.1 NINE protein [Bacillota bacterium]